MKVLLVDDNVTVLETLETLFHIKNYPLVATTNGFSALEILRKDKDIDVVVTDILMPEMDGFELCHHIKQEFPHIRVVAISGGISNVVVKSRVTECEATGMDKIVQKPFSWDVLMQAIDATK
jgi:CheY-like chemotaxis protein